MRSCAALLTATKTLSCPGIRNTPVPPILTVPSDEAVSFRSVEAVLAALASALALAVASASCQALFHCSSLMVITRSTIPQQQRPHVSITTLPAPRAIRIGLMLFWIGGGGGFGGRFDMVNSVCKDLDRLREFRRDSQFVHRGNQAADIVANDFRQHLIQHSRIRFATHTVPKFSLNHAESRFHVGPLVVFGEEFFPVKVEVVERFFKRPADAARGMAPERD